jgi:hypothetical protein
MRWRWTGRTVKLVFVVACVAPLAVRAAQWLRPTPKLVVGRDTTWLTGPLRADGTVDYAAAWRDEHGRGVTAENNAAPLLFAAAALDTSQFSDAERAATPRVEAPFELLEDWAEKHAGQFDASRKSPNSMDAAWKALESGDPLPRGAKRWLDAMAPALDLACRAVERGRFYDPAAWGDQQNFAWTLAEVAKALRWRATRAAVDGDVDAAGADTCAILKLTRLEHDLGVHLYFIVAFGDESYCLQAALNAARRRGRITVAEVRALVAADDPSAAEERIRELRRSERLHALEAIDDVLRPGTRRNKGFGKLVPLVARLDPNAVRRRQNMWYDREAADLATTDPWDERLDRFRIFWKSESAKLPAILSKTSVVGLLCKGPDTVTRELFDSFSMQPGDVSGYVLGPLLDTDRALIELAALAFATETGRDP